MLTFYINYVFNYSWKDVTYAHWNKYPNAYNTNVTHIDILDRNVENNILKTTRLITTKFNLPDFLNKFACENYVIETSEIDIEKQIFSLTSKNFF